MKRLLFAVVAVLALAPVASADRSRDDVRFATFNASLNRSNSGDLVNHLSHPEVDDVFRRQARNVAEVVQHVRPDVLLINEFDFDPAAVDLFRKNFLEVSQNGARPIRYRYSFIAPSNTGIPSGMDFSNDGNVGVGPNDAFGFGFFPGQFGMVVYSKHPIERKKVRTFQLFRWADMPGALLPDDPRTPGAADWYSPEELRIFRLSSKSHWDIPIDVGGEEIHFLVSHPTPPVFDDPPAFPAGVDFNGRRNHDEIRFWADYISGKRDARYIYDDRGKRGGLKRRDLFVIAGDQNSDPLDGDSIPGSAQQLLEHRLVNASMTPQSAGAAEAAVLQGGANTTHRGEARFDTADFSDIAPGNLRADYVLPHKSLRIEDSGVFWPLQPTPTRPSPLFRLTGVFDNRPFPLGWREVGGFPTSDHRLVWVDVAGSDKEDDDDDDD